MHWLTVTTCKSVGYTHGVELLGQQTCFRRYGSFPEWLCQFILSKVCEGYSCYPTFRILGLISTYGRYEALSCVFFCSFLSVIKWSAFSYVEQIFGYLLLWRAHLRLLQIFFLLVWPSLPYKYVRIVYIYARYKSIVGYSYGKYLLLVCGLPFHFLNSGFCWPEMCNLNAIQFMIFSLYD